jgi:hypothetical protein
LSDLRDKSVAGQKDLIQLRFSENVDDGEDVEQLLDVQVLLKYTFEDHLDGKHIQTISEMLLHVTFGTPKSYR